MDPKSLIQQLDNCEEYFNRSSSMLQEKDSNLRPKDTMLTAAQQVAHVAQTVDWFMEGTFRPEGFCMDWESMAQEIQAIDSLKSARAWVKRSFQAAREALSKLTAADLMLPLAEGEILGGEPRLAAFGALIDHSAHHRGALTVYARLAGYVPPMPYMEAQAAGQ